MRYHNIKLHNLEQTRLISIKRRHLIKIEQFIAEAVTISPFAKVSIIVAYK